jgi:glucosamine 6-phosphate synthetase-like amidotransferase/phosphosugar isomerase protein
MHKRQQIRTEIKSIIESAVSVPVYMNRVYPITDTQVVLIYPESESINYLDMGNDRTQRRTHSIRIEVAVRGKINYDNKIDDIMKQIEESLANTDLNGLAHDVMVTGYQVEFSGEAEVPVGAGILNVNVVYTTQESNVGET